MPLEVRVMGVAVIHSLSLPPFLSLSLIPTLTFLLSIHCYTLVEYRLGAKHSVKNFMRIVSINARAGP